jgi:hypothetical protein
MAVRLEHVSRRIEMARSAAEMRNKSCPIVTFQTGRKGGFEFNHPRFDATRQVLYSITKHAMRRSADEIGAISISFRPKVFSDLASVVD